MEATGGGDSQSAAIERRKGVWEGMKQIHKGAWWQEAEDKKIVYYEAGGNAEH